MSLFLLIVPHALFFQLEFEELLLLASDGLVLVPFLTLYVSLFLKHFELMFKFLDQRRFINELIFLDVLHSVHIISIGSLKCLMLLLKLTELVLGLC